MQLSKAGEKCFGCKESEETKLEFAGQYAYCAFHLAKRIVDYTKKNASYNGTPAHLLSLRTHYANKKGKVDVEIPILEAIDIDKEHFKSLLEPISDWLLSKKVVIYDTESDGVGATSLLEKTREYHFYDIAKAEHLNIWVRTQDKKRTNSDYSHDLARQQILTFLQDADFIIAYEPPNNDRNRLKELFGDSVYESEIAPKVICLKKALINRLFTTENAKDNIRVYLKGLTQPDV